MNKKEILNKCIEIQSTKVAKLKAMVETLNDSALGDDKCTVGDKHHTFRAQTQNEQELYAKQLQSATTELNTLYTISADKKLTKAQLGALIKTEKQFYFLATSMGIVNIDSTDVAVLSPVSPIGKLLLDKSKGENISFRGENILIEDIC